MTSEEFITGLLEVRSQIIDSVTRVLTRPPGRKPRKKDIEISEFYHSLNAEQKHKIKYILQETTDTSLFVFLCILDHVHFIEDTPEKTKFELYAVKDGQRTLLNDFEKDSLHDEFNSYVLDSE